jgi:hypothetical protein
MSTTRFNGRHVTAIVSAVCLAIVLAPVTVMATMSPRSTGTVKVYVTDPHNATHRAAVSAAGALDVGGTVTAAPGLPGQPHTDTESGTTPTAMVPAGRHFVVQTVSVATEVAAGSVAPFMDLRYTTGGMVGHLYFPLTLVYTAGGYDVYESTEQVSLYVDPGAAVAAIVTSNGVFGYKVMTVSGYLV